VTVSSRVIGWLLLAAGVVVGLGVVAWLGTGMREGTLRASGALFGGILLFIVIVIPLVAGGIFLAIRGGAEQRQLAAAAQQRQLLDIVLTRGQVSIPDLVLDLDATRDQVQRDLYALVGRGLFTGYVDWSKGMLYSVEASKLQCRQTCPNCGGPLQLVGKGLIKCPYCGAEIFLSG
jgi:ribosomal protein S27AE